MRMTDLDRRMSNWLTGYDETGLPKGTHYRMVLEAFEEIQSLRKARDDFKEALGLRRLVEGN